MASASDGMHAIHAGHGLLLRCGAESVPAALGQVWANCGVLFAVAAESTVVTGTWLVGVVGLALFHCSRAAVVWLERRDRYAVLQGRLKDLEEQHAATVRELRVERRSHARDREKFLAVLGRVLGEESPDEPPAALPPPAPGMSGAGNNLA